MPGKKILLIDDDPDIQESIALVLSAEGFEVLRASSAAEGIAAAAGQPDLIVCDMMMESVDAGMQAAETIRGRLPDVPIFLLSSIGEATAAANDMADIGFRGVFQKPVDPAHLLANIKSILGS